jgi:hypothetical protein
MQEVDLLLKLLETMLWVSNRLYIINLFLGKSLGKGTFGKVKLATHILTGEKVI